MICFFLWTVGNRLIAIYKLVIDYTIILCAVMLCSLLLQMADLLAMLQWLIFDNTSYVYNILTVLIHILNLHKGNESETSLCQ